MAHATEPLLAEEKGDFISLSVNNKDNDPVIPVSLEIQNLDYWVGKGKKEFHVLKGINAAFRPGDLTAIMGECVLRSARYLAVQSLTLHAWPLSGPSGAGKTTLLSVLIGNAGGRMEGGVTVNRRDIREVAKKFKQVFSFVPQDDVILASLTPREVLTFAAHLRLPKAWSK
jgi:ABC-type multidrug transport system ATPase subunit